MHGMKNMKKKKNYKLGTWLTIYSPESIEIITSFKFSWIGIDLEHSTINFEQLSIIISLIKKSGIEAWVRVGKNDDYLIKKTLDLGPEGIIVPMIKNKQDAIKAVKFSRYPPSGIRSFGYCKANKYGINFKQYINKSKKLKIILQIEHVDAINNLEEILSIKGINGTFIGPYDLSGSIKKPGNFNSFEFKNLILKYESLSLKKKIPMGFHQVQLDKNKFREIVKKKYKYICIGTDLEFLKDSYNKFLSSIKK